MENVRNFYDDISAFFNNELKKDDLYKDPLTGYKSIGNFDWGKTLEHKDKIINKALSLNEKDRLLYASFLIKEFDMVHPAGCVYNETKTIQTISVQEDNELFYREYIAIDGENIKGEKKDRIVYIYKTENDIFDVDAIYSDYENFPRLISEYFMVLGIDLEKMAERMEGYYSEYFKLSGLKNRVTQHTLQVKYNEWNKPILSTAQIALLFKIFKAKKIIMRDIDTVEMTRAINRLTGYSPNTVRNKLYDKPIVNTKEDIKALQDLLSEIVIDLDKEKKELFP